MPRRREGTEHAEIDNLHAFYGKSHVLHGVDMQASRAKFVALLGRNGSGRSTTAKAIMGLVECQGDIQWKDQQILGRNLRDCPSGASGMSQRAATSSQTDGAPEPECWDKSAVKEPRVGRLRTCIGCSPTQGSAEHTEAGVLSAASSRCSRCAAPHGRPGPDHHRRGLPKAWRRRSSNWWVRTCWNCASAAFRFC